MRLGGLVLTGVAFLGLAASAAAQESHTSGYFNRAGEPSLSAYAWSSASPVAVVEWRSCPPGGGACVPLPESAYTRKCPTPTLSDWWCEPVPRVLDAEPGDVPPGTVFEMVYERADTTRFTERTPPWTGRVTLATPPRIVSELKVGTPLDVRLGSWTGGWETSPSGYGSDYSLLNLIACPTPEGGTCWSIGRLDQRWAGWYLFLAETRYPAGTSIAASVPMLPFRLPGEWKPASVATAPVTGPLGPVCCVLPPPEPEPATRPTSKERPLVTIRARAKRAGRRVVVGRAVCATRCELRLTVSGGKRKTIRRTLTVAGATDLSVPARRGTLRVRVVADGKVVAAGRSVAR